MFRSSHPEVFLEKGVLKICSKFTGEHLCRSVISITLRHRCSPVNLLHNFRTTFTKSTSERLILDVPNRFHERVLTTNKNLLMMNKTKLNVYKKVLQKVCEKSDGAEEFINQKIEEIYY